MEFLIIVAALLLYRLMPDLSWLHKDRWYTKWVTCLQRIETPGLRFIASLGLPLLAVVIVVLLLNYHWHGVPLFLFGLLGLLYALGRGDLDARFRAVQEDFSRQDFQAAYHAAAEFNVNGHEGEAESSKEFHLDLLQSVSYRFFEHYFPVIFWFALLGVPGALLYRLSQIHAHLELDNGDERRLAEYGLWLMEWLPARLLGVTFALVGNFASCIHQWRQHLFNTDRSTRQVLSDYVIGALSADVEVAEAVLDVSELDMVRRLFYRALIFWVCAMALLFVF